MRWLVVGGAFLLGVVLVALLLLPAPGPRQRLLIGGVEDAAKWADPGGNMALANRAGFQVIVLSSVWQRPLPSPPAAERAALGRAITAALRAGIEPVVAVYSFAADTPRSVRDRLEFV